MKSPMVPKPLFDPTNSCAVPQSVPCIPTKKEGKPAVKLKSKRPGRKEKEGARMMRQVKTNQEKRMKFDNVCTKFTRMLVALVPKLLDGRESPLSLLAFDPLSDYQRAKLWEEMIYTARENRELLERLVKPENLPNSEQKKLRKDGVVPWTRWQCFTAEFSQGFYASEVVRKLFYLMVEMVFGSPLDPPEDVQRRVKAKCCPRLTHTEKCRTIWANYKHFVQFTMLKRLELSSYDPTASPTLFSETAFRHAATTDAPSTDTQVPRTSSVTDNPDPFQVDLETEIDIDKYLSWKSAS